MHDATYTGVTKRVPSPPIDLLAKASRPNARDGMKECDLLSKDEIGKIIDFVCIS